MANKATREKTIKNFNKEKASTTRVSETLELVLLPTIKKNAIGNNQATAVISNEVSMNFHATKSGSCTGTRLIAVCGLVIMSHTVEKYLVNQLPFFNRIGSNEPNDEISTPTFGRIINVS